MSFCELVKVFKKGKNEALILPILQIWVEESFSTIPVSNLDEGKNVSDSINRGN